ncbi:ribosome-associated translation inhibitor RaiA [Candidatus Saccharibacteria bacterium]|nr:ribosome-associated translation inhibitor RaiA [Candidatus Saccharibacteria bacterium]
MIASIDITGIHYEVDARTKKYARRKIGSLDRYVPKRARESVTADVKLSQIDKDYGNKYQAEAILHVPGKTLVAKDSTLNMMAAIDLVEAKLLAQLRKYKAEVTAKS